MLLQVGLHTGLVYGVQIQTTYPSTGIGAKKKRENTKGSEYVSE